MGPGSTILPTADYKSGATQCLNYGASLLVLVPHVQGNLLLIFCLVYRLIIGKEHAV